MKRATRTPDGSTSRTPGKTPHYSFRLYVTGTTPRSTRAIRNIRKLCEEHLTGRYDLEIVDIYQQPGLARDEQILAAPTLIKSLPLPLRRFIGDMSETERFMIGIGLHIAPGDTTR